MADEVLDDNTPQQDPLGILGKPAAQADPLGILKKNESSTIQSASPSLATSSTSLSEEKPKKDYDINQLLGKPASGIGVPSNVSESTSAKIKQPDLVAIQKQQDNALNNTATKRLQAKGIEVNDATLANEKNAVQKDVNSGNLKLHKDDNGNVSFQRDASAMQGFVRNLNRNLLNASYGIVKGVNALTGGDNTNLEKKQSAELESVDKDPYGSMIHSLNVFNTDEGKRLQDINRQTGGNDISYSNLAPTIGGLGGDITYFSPTNLAGGTVSKLSTAFAMAYPKNYAAKSNEIFNELKNKGVNDAEASKKADVDATAQAIPQTAMESMLFGGVLPSPKPAENLLNALGHAAKRTALFSAISGATQGSEELIKGKQGYDTEGWQKRVKDAIVNGAGLTAVMEALPILPSLPKYAQSAVKEYALQPEIHPIVESALNKMPNAEEVKKSLDDYQNARNKVVGKVPEQDIPTYAGLLNGIDGNNEKIKQLKSTLTGNETFDADTNKQIEDLENDNQIKQNKITAAKITQGQVPASNFETDELTGEKINEANKVQHPAEVEKPITEEVNQPIGEAEETKPKGKESIVPEHDNIETTPNYRTAYAGNHEGEQEFTHFILDGKKYPIEGNEELLKNSPDAKLDKSVESQTDTKKQQTENIKKFNVPLDEGTENPKGETMQDFVGRVVGQYEKDKANNPDNSVIVAHSSVLKALKTYEALKDKPEFKDADWNNLTPEQAKLFTDHYTKESTNNGDIETYDNGKGGKIKIARHGQTEDNLTGKFRNDETNLTPKGIKQAKEVGAELGEQPPKIISSDLPRAIHTANLAMDEIGKKSGVTVEMPEQVEKQKLTPKTEENAIPKQTTGEMGVRNETTIRKEVGRPNEPTGTTTETKPKNEGIPPTGTEKKNALGEEENNNAVGGSHESLNKLAKRLGLPEIETGEVLTPKEYQERGRMLIDNGADPEKIAKEFKEDDKVNADIISVATQHLVDLTRDADKAKTEFGIDSKEYKEALDKVNDWSRNILKSMGTKFGEIGRSLQGETDLDTGSFTNMSRKIEDAQGTPLSKDQKIQIERLNKETQELKQQIEDLSKKLSEKGTEEKPKTFTEKAKKAANQFRKLKQKEFTFKDKDGNDIPLQKMGVSWNDLVELGARAIEKSGEIADGIKAIVDKVKDADWYKKLSDDDKERFGKELESHYTEIADKKEAARIANLEKQLDDLRQGIVKEKKPSRELSEQEKDLKEQIFEAKKNLGLIPSKELPPTETEIADKKEAARIANLEKQLDDLRQGIVKEKKPSRELSEQEKDLKEQIFEAKKNLGLIPSKELPPTETEIAVKKKDDLIKMFLDKTDNKFTLKESKSIWDYAKKEYLDKGASLPELLNGVSKDLGLTSKQVLDAIESPKGNREISDEIFKKQYRYKKVLAAGQRMINEAKTPALVKWAKLIPEFFRSILLTGHGTVGMVTHGGMNVFDPSVSKIFWKSFFNQYKRVFGKTADYEKAMQHLVNDPLYTKALQAGVKVDPSIISDDMPKFKLFGEYISEMGTRGFNTLKEFRMDYFKKLYNQLPVSERNNKGALKMIGDLVNHSTGSTSADVGAVADNIFFAPRLITSQYERLVKDPYEAANVFANWKTSSEGEKIAAKAIASKSAYILGAYFGALGINSALLKASGSNDKVNYTDPTKSDWLDFKIANHTIGIGGIMTAIRFLGHLLYIPFENKQELGRKTRADELIKTVYKYGASKLHPAISTVKDFTTAHDFSGNTMPYSNDKPLNKFAHKLTWKEYIYSNHLPIPASEVAKTVYEGMRNEGLSEAQTSDILTGIMKGIIVGGTGLKVGNEYNTQNRMGKGASTGKVTSF